MARDAHGVGHSSSSSCSNRRHKYDVFLSFRGEDTRKGFTSHLYTALQGDGLMITFRDEEGLKKGEAIKPSLLQAIEESFSAIVVLSKNYANSTWCLDELLRILYSKKELGLHVFPIFYDVDPSDVRHQRGIFEEAFKQHEQKVAQDKVQQWREAFEEVANMVGWNSQLYGFESKLIEDVAEVVRSKLYGQPLLDLSDDGLVGINAKIREFDSVLAKTLGGIQFIGIWGMGGLGKTTLARAVYKRIYKNYDVDFFLHNVREESTKDGGLIKLQNTLLSHPSRGIRREVVNCFEGREFIGRMLCKTKVLLVLDDVSDISQLENLAGEERWFGKGSTIIITTRDQHLLVAYGVFSRYQMNFLSQVESLQLFLQIAFKGNQPDKDYLELSEKAIKFANGLPLALKVFGSFLCRRSKSEWEDALKKIPLSNDIFNTLKVSFDGLEDNEKNIFLDIACFFNGMDKKNVMQILENIGLRPVIGISVLIEKSMLTEDEGFLRMHDMLEEMGKKIVFLESPGDAGRRSRIWSLEDANHVLGKKRFLQSLKFLDLRHLTNLIRTPNFEKIPNLQRLILEGCTNLVEVHHSLGQHKNLAIVDFKGCKSIKTLPTQFEMDCLETFVLSGCSKVENIPEFGEGMRRLSRLDLGGTATSKLPQSLVNLIGLAILNLRGCKNLVCLPSDFQKLKAIKKINLYRCSKFSRLPENLNENEALEELEMGRTAIKEVPSSLNLKVLYLGCRGLVSSSTKFLWGHPLTNLSSLVKLDLSYCNLDDESLSSEIGNLSSLTTLVLSGNNFVEVPCGLISELGKLEYVSFHDCRKLQSLPHLPSNLSSIHASDCPLLKHYICEQQLWEFVEQFDSQTRDPCRTEIYDNGLKFHYLNDWKSSLIITKDSQVPDLLMQPTRILSIAGSEVPSWFHNQNYFCAEDFRHENVSFKVEVPDSCDSSEWWGIAVCLVLEYDLEYQVDFGVTINYVVSGSQHSNSQHVSWIFRQFCCRHEQCIIYVRCSSFFVKQLQMLFYAFPHTVPYTKVEKSSVKIEKCGWRVLCKEHVERWRN